MWHRSLEKSSEPKWKGSVCLCWPVPWCLTTAYRPSKELPSLCDPLTHKGLGCSLCSTRLGLGPLFGNACIVEELQSQISVCVLCHVTVMYFGSSLVDVNECDEEPCGGKGRCVNSYGSYTCQCYSGYSQVITQNRKFCQGETRPSLQLRYNVSSGISGC